VIQSGTFLLLRSGRENAPSLTPDFRPAIQLISQFVVSATRVEFLHTQRQGSAQLALLSIGSYIRIVAMKLQREP
jgi:hypothetical protein